MQWPIAARGLVIEQPHVDALVETDLEPAASGLLDARLPLLARLAEEIVVEQMQMAPIKGRRARSRQPGSPIAARPLSSAPRKTGT